MKWLALVSDQFQFLNVPLVIAYLVVHSGTLFKVAVKSFGGS